MDFGPKSWIFGILNFCPGILVPGFGVPEVRGPDFKSLSSRHAASGGSKFSKMTPPEFQRSFRLHFWQLSGHKTPNHHTLKMKSESCAVLWDARPTKGWPPTGPGQGDWSKTGFGDFRRGSPEDGKKLSENGRKMVPGKPKPFFDQCLTNFRIFEKIYIGIEI